MLQATALASVAWLAFGASPFASQAHRPDTINIDFDVPSVGQHLLKKGASSNQVSFLSVNDDAASDVAKLAAETCWWRFGGQKLEALNRIRR